MNIINRILVVATLILLLVTVTAACLFPDFWIQQFKILADFMDELRPRIALADRLILLAIAAAVDVGLLLLLVLELRRPKAKSVRVQQVEGGMVVVTVDSIEKRLGFYIDGLEDVVSVKPKVEVKRNQVVAAVDVQTSATVAVPSKAREIVSVIKMVIAETMGHKLYREPACPQVLYRGLRRGSRGRMVAPGGIMSSPPARAYPPAPPTQPASAAETTEIRTVA